MDDSVNVPCPGTVSPIKECKPIQWDSADVEYYELHISSGLTIPLAVPDMS